MSLQALEALEDVASDWFIQRHVEVVDDIKDFGLPNKQALAARVNMDMDRFKNKFATFIIVDEKGLEELKADMETVRKRLMKDKKRLEWFLNYTPGPDVDYMDHGQVSTQLDKEYLQVTFKIDQGDIKFKQKKGVVIREGNMYCTASGAEVETALVPICFGNKLDENEKKTKDIHIVHYGAIKDEASTKSVHIGGMKTMTKEDEIYETIAEMKTEIRNLTSWMKQYAPHAPLSHSQPRYGYGNARKGGKRRPKNLDEKTVIWV